MSKLSGIEKIHDNIKIERRRLDKQISSLSNDELMIPGVTKGGWNVKDCMAHILDWEERLLKWYNFGKEGKKVHLPDENYTW